MCNYWADGYDWRAAERGLNAFEHFIADVDGVRVHYVHVRRGGIPLILTHGWPSAFIEPLPLVERLPGFDLVLPSLPGYGFSTRPERCTTRDVASLWHRLMQGLGYERYGAGGGDWGAAVATYMALEAPERLLGIHLSNLDNAPPPTPPLSAAERAFLAATEHWDATQRGYSFIQGTKPQTLAYALTDSPAGLAAWIAEKFWKWSDCSGVIENAVSRDDLLANVSLYWFTGAIGSSFWPYYARMHGPWPIPEGKTVDVPTGYAAFPTEILRPPRSLAARTYTDIRRWTTMPRGGHFAALEQPELLAREIVEFFASLR